MVGVGSGYMVRVGAEAFLRPENYMVGVGAEAFLRPENPERSEGGAVAWFV
jgi:hypothetical protein